MSGRRIVTSRVALKVVGLVLLCALAMPSEAAPIYTLSIGSANVAPNGVGEVAVTITGSGEAVNLVGYEFRSTPTGGASSQVQFLEESESFLSDAAYLFAGNSAAANDATPSSVGS